MASAAPDIPILNLNIKIGSNIILTAAPINTENIEYFGLPSALIIWLITVENTKGIKPIEVMLV